MNSNLSENVKSIYDLFEATGVCFWIADDDGITLSPVGCEPRNWAINSFSFTSKFSNGLHLSKGGDARSSLPMYLRSRYNSAQDNLSVLSGIGKGGCGFFVVWEGPAVPPVNVLSIGRFVLDMWDKQAQTVEEASDFEVIRAQLESLVMALPQGVVVVPQDEAMGLVNPMAARLLGLDAGAVKSLEMAQALNEFVHRVDHAEEIMGYVSEALQGNQTALGSRVWHFSGEQEIDLHVTIAPILEHGGEGWVWLIDDVTKKEETARALAYAKDSAEKANQAKSNFLSSMSHELRTPMNAILGFAQMLDFNPKEPLTPSQKSCVSQILKGGQHLLNLINDILDLAKIEAGKVELSIENISPMKILDECMELIKIPAEKRNITIFPPDVQSGVPSVRADYTRFKQVLLNLMTNAVKYNQDNGTITISFSTTTDNMLRIFITDTGAGIPKSKHKDLFQPFSRLGAETTDIEGTGIGLVVCKDLVELMNGTINVESEVGKGSVFWFELPMSSAISESDTVVHVIPENINGGDFPHIVGKLLYVEDNPANLQLMELIVNRIEGLSMISAQTGELGIKLAKSEKPDLIILDINLPGLSGIDVLEQIRNCAETKTIPVIALSAAATAHDIKQGTNAGFLKYLTKPLEVQKVVLSIQSAIGDT